ncbi:hypothetical protein HRI_004673900 [Hibiscus trionum]|uniref:AAA+ ATPase domain-containing protein n=1 Tax=Hibiscus trionum TaxID=183268 RepID=A0A9W7JBZ7_HIBTR|nr:hypothetical protein HRI_004673900 [Hibiscus trionum]
MAGEFCLAAASNAVGTLMVDYLVKPIERRIRYLFRFPKLVRHFRLQQNNLNREQTRVNGDVKEAKLQIRTQVIEDCVNEWLTDAENTLKDAQSLDSRIEENKRCFRWCPNWSWRYRLSKEIEKKTEYISKLVQGSQFKRIGHRAELPGLEFFPSSGILPSKTSTAALNKVMEALKDEKVNMIGVWGMGGVGKTTLVKRVGKRAKELKHFQAIKVDVSQTPNVGDIQNKIADLLNLKFEKTTTEGKAEELWVRLEKEEKVLVILDDVWKEVDLKEIGLPLNENGKGCKIILATRSMSVCQDMKCQPTVPVDVLDDDEAWALFRMKAELDERVSTDILGEAKKVAEECKGLPVAIVTVAKALKGTKSRNGWEMARKKLESNRLIEIGNIGADEKNAYACIRTSYDYLGKETTKRCFLWCALYPEDHSIDMEYLVRNAWALNLYPMAESVEDVRNEVLEALKYLKDCCLLLEDRQRHVKLHDMVRDVALWITSKEESGFMIKSCFGLLNDSLEPCMAISLLDNESKKFPEKLVCPKLEFLLLNNCVVQGLCFQGMQELKVLSLTMGEDYGRFISLYPLKFLGKLRSLHLEDFQDFSFLGNLRTLEIFSSRGPGSGGLADELRKLENLKILDLADTRFSNGFPGDVIRRLSKLEELYLRCMEGENTAILLEINFLTSLTTLSLAVSSLHFPKDFRFPKLKRYEICINRSGSMIFSTGERRLQVERSLIVQRIDLNQVSQLLENIESLGVAELEDECLSDKTQRVLVPKFLQYLKKLSIVACGNLKVVFQNVQENNESLLSNLKLLYLEQLPKLSHIWELPIQHVRLEALVELKIWSCPSLKSIFSISLAQSLALLEYLDIRCCGELKQIVTESESDEEEISTTINSPNSLCFPKLRKVHISKCDGLEYIFPTMMAPQGLPQLENLRVHDCGQLKQLVRRIEGRTENDVELQPLTKFSVSGCPLLSDSFVGLKVEEAHLEDVRLSAFMGSFSCQNYLQLGGTTEDHNVVPEANKDGLNGLTSLHLSSCKDLECLVDTTTGNGPTSAFTHLKILKITHSHGLETLCNGSAHSFSLQSLKVVNIGECGKLESLFSLSLIQSLVMLEELRISRCHGLKTLIAELENNDDETESNSSLLTLFLPKLKTLDISDCQKLEYALPITAAKGLPALATISISGCGKLKQVFRTVKEQNGVEQDGIVCLGNLQYLRLRFLWNLSCFAPENYIFKAPALETLKVDVNPELMNFAVSQVGKKRKLKLIVTGFQQLQEVFRNDEENQAPPLLSNVEHLKLQYLPELRWIVKVPTHSVSFQSLLVLEIVGCHELKYLFSLSAIQTIRSLQQLKIAYCKELKSVFMELERSDDNNIESSTLYLPNLKTVDISACPNVEYVSPLALAGGLPFLQEIRLRDLENLCSFFAENSNIVEAHALEILQVIECPRFTIIIQNEANKSLSVKELVFRPWSLKMASVRPLGQISPGLEYLTMGNFEQVFQLHGGYSISNLEDLRISNMIWLRHIWKGPIRFATNLRILHIISCDGLTYIFPIMLIQNLPHLNHLRIEYCEKLEQIIAIDDSSASSQGLPFQMKIEFPQLQEMELSGLPSLVSFSPLGYHLVFPSLNSFKVVNCKKMITSFMMDYSTLAVHAKTEQQVIKELPPNRDIKWDCRRPLFLKTLLKEVPQYVEEAEEISTLN